MDIYFEKDLCKTIYFDYYMEDYWKKEVILQVKNNRIRDSQITQNYLVTNLIDHKNIQQIANIHIRGGFTL